MNFGNLLVINVSIMVISAFQFSQGPLNKIEEGVSF